MQIGRGLGSRWRVVVALCIGTTTIVTLAIAACGGSTGISVQTPPSTHTAPSASAPSISTVTRVAVTATAFAGTPSPLRTPATPHDYACFRITNPATPTAVELAQAHGNAFSCYALDRTLLVGVPGGSADPRPGFLQCAQPPAETDDYCGVGLAPVTAGDRSYAERWEFYPMPASDAQEVGEPVFPQQYQCVGNASQLWTFHFDTLTYTSGCTVPPSFATGATPCDSFLYLGMDTTPDLYATYGKPAACQLYGTSAVGVMDGHAEPGLIVCRSARTVQQVRPMCGFDLGVPPVTLSVWQFVPLPVPAGPADSATFDTAAGTACVTVGAQSFTFTLATMAVTAGCAPGAAATATP